MKSLLITGFFLLSYSIFGQTNPQVIFASPDLIQGTGEIGTT